MTRLTLSRLGSPLLAVGAALLLSLPAAAARKPSVKSAAAPPVSEWRFAVSGDSRNCGDVVMPGIAAHALADHALFYWHLGDFRLISHPDEDYKQLHPTASSATYEQEAWPDFIEHQLKPFGELPIYLARGNHETMAERTEGDYLTQFSPWLDTPELRARRQSEGASASGPRTYYDWKVRNVAFVTLDNSTPNQIDTTQMNWLTAVLSRTASDAAVRSVVLGMHAALPDSLSAGHSMNDTVQGLTSGRVVYAKLLDFQRKTGKHVYVLASHSHFYMDNVYATDCRSRSSVLPGWIVGTAGAQRHRLPLDADHSHQALADTYGYLLATVGTDGSVRFAFKPLNEEDVPAETSQRFTPGFVHACFTGNKTTSRPEGAHCELGFPVRP